MALSFLRSSAELFRSDRNCSAAFHPRLLIGIARESSRSFRITCDHPALRAPFPSTGSGQALSQEGSWHKNSPPQLRRGGALSAGVVVTVVFHGCLTTIPSLTSHRKYRRPQRRRSALRLLRAPLLNEEGNWHKNSPPQLRRGGALSAGVVVTVVSHACHTTLHSLTSHREYRRPQRRRSALRLLPQGDEGWAELMELGRCYTGKRPCPRFP
jgi:hypothetical protein